LEKLHKALPTKLNIDEPNTGYFNSLFEFETHMRVTPTG